MYYVITDDIVTGGNDIKAYSYISSKQNLLKIPFETLFEKELIDYFLSEGNTCKQNLKDDSFTAFLKYDFTENNISMFNQDGSNNYLKYNKIYFELDKTIKKFKFLKGVKR